MKNIITAQRLREALTCSGMRQEDLANASGVSKASISQYINGSHTPSNISSGKLASVLRVNPLWLMGFDVPKEETAAIVPDFLTPEEITLLGAYRTSSEEIKTAACAVLGITRKKGSSSVSNNIG